MNVEEEANAKTNASSSQSGTVPRAPSADIDFQDSQPYLKQSRLKALWIDFKRSIYYLGPAWLAAIAYLDPGNLEGDLSAGSLRSPEDPFRGYKLLWVLLWATIIGLNLQIVAIKLAVCTGKDLPTLCRSVFPSWLSIVVWVFVEICLIGIDTQAVVGSAIAYQLLFNLPLAVGVAITLLDTFFMLLITCYGVRKLELFFGLIVAFMGICFVVNAFTSKPSVTSTLRGLVVVSLPDETLQFAIQLIGSVIMPHNFFLQTSVVLARPIDHSDSAQVQRIFKIYSYETIVALAVSLTISICVVIAFANPKISQNDLDLSNAHYALKSALGPTSATIWGLGLLAAGTSSTMAGAYCGQFVMEGLLNFHIKRLWLRVLVTRLISIVPVFVIVFFTKETIESVSNGVNTMQAVLMPFVLTLLIKFSNSKGLMENYRVNIFWAIGSCICGLVLITANVFYLTSLTRISSKLLYVLLVLYFIALGYLCWKPLSLDEGVSVQDSLKKQDSKQEGTTPRESVV